MQESWQQVAGNYFVNWRQTKPWTNTQHKTIRHNNQKHNTPVKEAGDDSLCKDTLRERTEKAGESKTSIEDEIEQVEVIEVCEDVLEVEEEREVEKSRREEAELTKKTVYDYELQSYEKPADKFTKMIEEATFAKYRAIKKDVQNSQGESVASWKSVVSVESPGTVVESHGSDVETMDSWNGWIL